MVEVLGFSSQVRSSGSPNTRRLMTVEFLLLRLVHVVAGESNGAAVVGNAAILLPLLGAGGMALARYL